MFELADWTRTEMIAVVLSIISLVVSILSAKATFSQAASAKRMVALESSRDAPFVDEVRVRRGAFPSYFEVAFRITNRQPSILELTQIAAATPGFRVASDEQLSEWTLMGGQDPKAFQPSAKLNYKESIPAADPAKGKSSVDVHLFVRGPSSGIPALAHRIARFIRKDQTISLIVVLMSTMQPTSRTSIKVTTKLPSATKTAEIKA